MSRVIGMKYYINFSGKLQSAFQYSLPDLRIPPESKNRPLRSGEIFVRAPPRRLPRRGLALVQKREEDQ